MLKTVYDTNIMISAFLKKGGLGYKLLDAARNNQVKLYLSEEILEEVEDVLNRPKLRKKRTYTDEDIKIYLGKIRSAAEIVKDLPSVTIVRDPDDDMVIATALKAEATYIVTKDDDLLSIGIYKEIQIIKPEDFINKLNDKTTL